MSTYRKEKNMVYFALDGVGSEKEYALDINIGVFYGLNGTPIKTLAKKRLLVNLLQEKTHATNLSLVIADIIENQYGLKYLSNFTTALMTADRADALGICPLRMALDSWTYISNHFKQFTAYLKENLYDTNYFNFAHFQKWSEYNEAIKENPCISALSIEQFSAVKAHMGQGVDPKEWEVIIYYLTKCRLWDYHGRLLPLSLLDYLKYCKALNIEPRKVSNFTREYCEMRDTYNLQKEKYDNDLIVRNYQRHEQAWQFEYDNFTIVIPKTGQDLIDEGKKMHHCVGRYVQRVVDNTTYICFIRRKDDIDTPYITCQVSLEGQIQQYYLSYDRIITEQIDCEFKKAFQEYLLKVWQ